MPSRRPNRFALFFCLIAGAALLIGAVVSAAQAGRQSAEISAYRHARPCLAGAGPNADCLQPVAGSVTGVVESPAAGRIPANYALDVQTASQALHITFTGDSAMLGYAVDGDPVLVTMWRGVAVSVMTDGRSQQTAAVPRTEFAMDLGHSAEAGGAGLFLFLGGLAIRRNQKVAAPAPPGPMTGAVLLALGLGSVVIAAGGFALGGKSSRLAPVVTGTGAALLVVAGLAAWLGISAARRTSRLAALGLAASSAGRPAYVTPGPGAPAHNPPGATEFSQADRLVPGEAGPADDAALPPPPRLPGAPRVPRTGAAVPRRTRVRHAISIRRLRANAIAWAGTLLTVGVLFGVLITSADGPAARAYGHAPACVGETNLTTCTGDFTAVINGIRTPGDNGDNYADISYVTADDAINSWATFDGDSAALARAASADESRQTRLTIKVWRGAIVGADFGGTWHWAQGDPPGDAIPATFLAVCFALLLALVRVRAHQQARRLRARDGLLIVEDAGQAVAGAGAIWLLEAGFWPAAVLVVAVMVWLGLSARRAQGRVQGLAVGRPAVE